MKFKNNLYFIFLMITIGVISLSNSVACDVKTTAQISTPAFDYNCIYGSNSNCCVSIVVPSNTPFKIFSLYLLYGSNISCATNQPNLCHAWSNQPTNYNTIYPSGTIPTCGTSVPINNYIYTKTCNY